ncbi:hypothetical protein D3C77_644910 [compost metagenome]
MSRTVAVYLKPVSRINSYDLNSSILINRRIDIYYFTIQFSGNRIFAQARANRARNFFNCCSSLILSYCAIRQCYLNRHFLTTSQVVCTSRIEHKKSTHPAKGTSACVLVVPPYFNCSA